VHRRTALALLSVSWTTAPLAGCLVPPHDDFGTPQDAVLTFQSAFARDDEFKEYDCLAREMKSSFDPPLTQQMWSTARTRIFEPLGAIGRCVLRRNSLEDNLLGGAVAPARARLVYSLFGNELEVELAAEPVFTLPDPRSGGETAFPISRDSASGSGFVVRGDEIGASTLVVVIEAPAELARRLLQDGVAWAALGERWKIAGVRTLDEPPAELSPLPPPDAVETKELRVPTLRPVRLGGSLGVVRLRFELPLGVGGSDVKLPRPAGAPARWRWVAVAPARTEG
jgi:hypothetical protein